VFSEQQTIPVKTSLTRTAPACILCMTAPETGPSAFFKIMTQYACFKQKPVDSMTAANPNAREPALTEEQ
jgi:hypothetical protein